MRLLVLALSAAFLILATTACSGDQSAEPVPSVPLEQEAPTDPVDAEAPATSPGPATAEEVAAGFLEALGSFDVDRAITYLAPDADLSGLISSMSGGPQDGSLEGFRLLLSMLEAEGYKQILHGCDDRGSGGGGTSLTCDFDFHVIRSDELGLGPYSGSNFLLTVRDGKIVGASMTWAIGEFSPQVWDPFGAWVEATYPEDVEVMYTQTGLRLTEESVALWEQRSREYVQEVRAGHLTPVVADVADVAYAPPEPEGSAGHLLDLYLPSSGTGPWPLVIWSSGSGWMRDDGKSGALELASFFTKAGYAVAGVSVRSSAQATFPAQLHDVKAAIRWLRAHAAEHNLDPERFAIIGDSSGGWLAAMAALTGDEPTLEGAVGETGGSSAVQAAVDFFGPTDFLQMNAHMPKDCAEFKQLLNIYGCHEDPQSPESLLVGGPIETLPEAVAQANPISYVDPGDPPIMLLHGQADPLVPHHQSELLFAALEKGGGEALFYSIPNVGHEHPYLTNPSLAEGYVVSSTRPGEAKDAPPPSWETIERFIAAALQGNG